MPSLYHSGLWGPAGWRNISRGIVRVIPRPLLRRWPMTVRLLPEDRYDAELRSRVHPPDWANPEPAPRTTWSSSVRARPGWSRRPAPPGSAPGWPCRAGTAGRRLPQRRLRPVQGPHPLRPRRRRGARRRQFRHPGSAGRAGRFPAVMERMRRLRPHQPQRLGGPLSRPRRGRLLGQARFHRPGHGRGGRPHPPLPQGRHRHRRPRPGPQSRAGRGGLPHQRDGLRPDGAAARWP